MALSTNWWDIVKMPPSFNLEMRSCFICGDMSIGNKTTRDMASLKLVVQDQESWIKGHTIHTCMRNIFEESNKQQSELPFDERTMACCFQCNTWRAQELRGRSSCTHFSAGVRRVSGSVPSF